MTLARFVVRRAAGGLVFALVVASLALLLARLAPGDASTVDLMPPHERAALRAELGLDQPLLTHYGRWLAGLARFDLGRSSLFKRPVAELVGERALNTALLATTALVVASLVGIPLGRYHRRQSRWRSPARCARRRWPMLSLPPLLSALLLVFFAAQTGWLPVGGMTSGGLSGAAWLSRSRCGTCRCRCWRLALPLAATLERVQARAMAEAIGRPFVDASRARGLSRNRGRARARLAGVAGAGARHLRRARGRALQRLVRGRGRHLVARVSAACSSTPCSRATSGSWPVVAPQAPCRWLSATTLADVVQAMLDPRLLEGRG